MRGPLPLYFQRFRVPGLRPYIGLNRPEPTPPPPPPSSAAISRGQAEVLAEVVEAPTVYHVNKFGRRKTSDPGNNLRTTRSLAGLSVRPRAPPREYYEQGRDVAEQY